MDVVKIPSRGKTVCIIVAGGKGLRLGGDEPKQFLLLGGRPLVSYGARHFDGEATIDEIVLVVPQGWEERAGDIMREAGLSKPWRIATGGERRQDSVMAGLMAVGECGVVVVQDGARPFPPGGLEAALAMVGERTGVIYAAPVTDSIKAVDGDGKILRTVPRVGLWGAQTPQIFRRADLLEALEWCEANGVEMTDDASAFEKLGWTVRIVEGSVGNIKVTLPGDFWRAELLLKGDENAR